MIGDLKHDSPIMCLAIAPDGLQAVVGDEMGRVKFVEIEYQPGPLWIAPHTTFRKPPIWKHGSPYTELLRPICLYCGATDEVDKNRLGHSWTCRKCGQTMMLCPRSVPYLGE
jgi:hypothetical protein